MRRGEARMILSRSRDHALANNNVNEAEVSKFSCPPAGTSVNLIQKHWEREDNSVKIIARLYLSMSNHKFRA